MNLNISYKRLNPDTKNGDVLILTHTYSSFDKQEIDNLEEQLMHTMGSVIEVKEEAGERICADVFTRTLSD